MKIMKYNDACKAVGYHRTDVCPIKAETAYFAYKEGEAKKFTSKKEALEFSPIIENVILNKDVIKRWYDERKYLEKKANDYWIASLKSQYIDSDFNEELFKLCFEEANERACGYDEIESCMESYYEFACKVRKVKIK